MSLMLLSCHWSQCCWLLSSLFCVALLSFAKTNLSPSALWCNLIFSHLHTWEKDFYVCFKNLRNWGRFVRPVWHKNKNKQTNKNKNLRNRGRFVRPARHKPSAASLAARRRLSPGQRPVEKMCHIELETSFCKNTRYCQIKKKTPVDLGLAAPGNQRNTLLQAPLAETGSRPIRLISTSETQNGNRNTLFLIFTFPPGTRVHQEGYLEKLQRAHRWPLFAFPSMLVDLPFLSRLSLRDHVGLCCLLLLQNQPELEQTAFGNMIIDYHKDYCWLCIFTQYNQVVFNARRYFLHHLKVWEKAVRVDVSVRIRDWGSSCGHRGHRGHRGHLGHRGEGGLSSPLLQGTRGQGGQEAWVCVALCGKIIFAVKNEQRWIGVLTLPAYFLSLSNLQPFDFYASN